MSVSKLSSSLPLIFDPKYTSNSSRKYVQRIIVTSLGRRLYRSDKKETKKNKKTQIKNERDRTIFGCGSAEGVKLDLIPGLKVCGARWSGASTHGAAAYQRRRSSGASTMEEEMKTTVRRDDGNGKLRIQNPNDERQPWWQK
ncbi:hypothetical protein DEO72_LG2g2337 [Vigna unguiculata]|uniref:Uncharacterized protein n=1 Tax=Vigna unguiculata TaxID=3917 RepID=A0A4D6KZ81_VIGUN|nr:hypothetical protein DEO72_LG2g2337 [Vigna unguiculata]